MGTNTETQNWIMCREGEISEYSVLGGLLQQTSPFRGQRACIRGGRKIFRAVRIEDTKYSRSSGQNRTDACMK